MNKLITTVVLCGMLASSAYGKRVLSEAVSAVRGISAKNLATIRQLNYPSIRTVKSLSHEELRLVKDLSDEELRLIKYFSVERFDRLINLPDDDLEAILEGLEGLSADAQDFIKRLSEEELLAVRQMIRVLEP